MAKTEHVTPLGDQGMYILDTGKWRNFRPVLAKDKCSRCGICFTFCPVSSITRVGGDYEISMSYCKGCGICAQECPRQAIAMVPEGGKE